MATKNAANQLAQYVQTMRLAACRRVLAKGRSMQAIGQWESDGGDDVFACWQQTLDRNEKLPESYDLNVSYVDTKSFDDVRPSSGTVFMSHGSPGSHNDFKYIIPILVEKNIRVVVPNFPGYGMTDAPAVFRQSNDERAEFLKDVADELGLDKVDVMVGHSAGCYPLFKLAADDQYLSDKGPICRTLLLVNPGGALMPHKAIRPYWGPRIAARLQHMRLLRPLIGWSQYMAWNYILGLRVPSGEAAMAGTDMIANVGLSQLPKYVQRLCTDPQTPRILMLYSEDDPLIEKERGEETAAALGIDRDKILKVSDAEDAQKALSQIRRWVAAKEGAKHAAVAFVKDMGGHYLQKHQATFIASCLEMLMPKSS